MTQEATTRFPIHALLSKRWSPRALSTRSLSSPQVGSLFEAARWAPSSYNEQPWVFLAATDQDPAGHAKLAACLVEGNAWARRAPLLILAVAKLAFARNASPNRHAQHDVGLAVENLMLEAFAQGLVAHAMAGFDSGRAREHLNIPTGYDPLTMIAVGYQGPAEQLPENLRAAQTAPRVRKPLSQVVFGAGWEHPLSVLS